MALKCREIPELPGLGAIHLRGGSSGVDNTVRWPYLAENRSFSNWVRGGELVFVTGISSHRSPANLAECLHEGRDCGISGLVVLTGDAYIGQLPAMLSRLADGLAIPLFEQPYSLPLVDVTETIARAIVASERAQEPREGGLAEALIASIGSHQLERLTRQYLPGLDGALMDSRDLLEAWLNERGNQCAMAEALGCHRNTIRNRMNRLVEEMPPKAEPNEYFKTLVLAHLLSRP
ncbi:PucR C-terminal helix-turn-helix domain-containing protein [Marinobacter sp. es.048]|uniref:PucR family transcriptional regulator n=1 Tax=Marinobacter sp. es.048 TaxID=1761795 RepID=UPI000B58E689|nr:PucR family transcriptional regulator [Marinobacter sp. es.048]SNC59593.1 PucR C-terminal helix-turn-helix domain-containing protein [Marinobacter sp. es.048]